MAQSKEHSFGGNVSLLRQKASKHSILGSSIAIMAVIIATLLSAYFAENEISISSIINVQKNNVVLWFLDFMPFIFALWGQYVSSIMSYEASALIIDQTHELRAKTELMEQKAAHEATHDSLTGLPNRMLFIDRLQQAINSAKRSGGRLGVFILDMDRFKEVNDTLGHYCGDRLLKLLSMRLAGVIREADTLARIGGDEFGFILSGIRKESDIHAVAGKIQKALSTSFALENMNIAVQVSVGAAIFPSHGHDADTLIQRADVAMYVAKQESQEFVVYTEDFAGRSQHKLTLMGELRQAITGDELRLHYQPQVTSKDGNLFGAEALVRWQHPEHGLMSPDEFIPLAERTGLIKELTIWVLKKALQQCSDWHHSGFSVSIAVNIFSRFLHDPEFPETLAGLLAAHDLPAQSLVLEITETSIMVDPERALSILNRITEMGIKLSIDDFGTGYSSLSYLKQLPVSELKIDRSFVMEMLENESDSAIVNATIQLGHNLGLQVVAEGVESLLLYEKLRDMGCDFLQGFYFSEPVTAEKFYIWAQNPVFGDNGERSVFAKKVSMV